MRGVEMARRGRYGCGCVVRATYFGGGAVRYSPLCLSHGEGFALSTLLVRSAIGIVRNAMRTVSRLG